MKIADLYIRVSTEEQADKGYSQRDQEERLKRYCAINSIEVRKVIYEDHSAKTFKRPAWTKLLIDLKKNRGKSDLILFIKWDRFSRNAGDAYQMISTLRKLGVEPQAIEQPLDISIPENKMMLAFYLAAPEVENDRRALNTFHGMRRAKKEGRWMATAPLGYINTVIDGKKAIAPDPIKSKILIWAFNTLAEGRFNVNQIWKEAIKKGLKCANDPFRRALINPVYCGKIIVPKYAEEEAIEVIGTHEAIISQELFYKVQDVITRNSKPYAMKLDGDELFPLRGFLECPKCGKNITGSSSKGKTKYYNYYHCQSSCGVRFSAELMNNDFIKLLKKYELPNTGLTLARVIFKQLFDNKTKMLSSELTSVKNQLKAAQTRVKNARELLLSGDLDGGDYRDIKIETEKTIDRLESKLEHISSSSLKFHPEIIDKMANLSELYNQGSLSFKKRAMSSIFPQKITYTKSGYRTPEVNSVVEAMSLINRGLQANKKGTKLDLEAMYLKVTLKLQNSNSFLRDLKLLELLVAA